MHYAAKTLNALFAQLGLPSDDRSIERFIASHRPLHAERALWEEPFWTPAQAHFLEESWADDADWVETVDSLSALLHKPDHRRPKRGSVSAN
ncbi:MAG: DUF2789 domain-containing protein [Betaproteobacteria bacterium]|nr:DUF2789 domain-containing protein [Betaproteobacteria bacterium]